MRSFAPLLLVSLLAASCGDGSSSESPGGAGGSSAAAGASAAGASGASAAGAAGSAGGDGAGAGGQAGGGGGAGAAPAPIDWKPCPLHSEGDGPPAECATVQVPLRREQPEGEAIDLYVRRYRPAGSKAKQALWMLQGGPGGSGYAFEKLAEAIGAKYPDVEFYIPDHRGTGKSTRLGCPKYEASSSLGGIFIIPYEWPNCLKAVEQQWGDRLPAFSTSNAANDIGVLIERTRRSDQPVFVYGASYGTYWSIRYLQLFPQQADGVILDSMAPPGMSLARQDQDADEAGKDLLTFCGQDAFCASKLGPDPWARAQALWAKLDEGHCAQLLLQGEPPLKLLVRRSFGQMMSWGARVYIPAAIARLERCNEQDQSAIRKMINTYVPSSVDDVGEFFRQWGWVLSNNITLSEIWETPSPTAAELQAIRDKAIVSRDITEGLEIHIGTWPVYTDPLAGQWPQTQTPMLMLAGGLDPATLLRKQRDARPHFAAPHQHWIEFPAGTHGLLGASPTVSGYSCATRLLMNFLAGPQADLDTSCLAELAPVDFHGTAQLSSTLFGTTDAWELAPQHGRRERIPQPLEERGQACPWRAAGQGVEVTQAALGEGG